MSGINCLIASSGPYGAAAAPLSCDIELIGGAGPWNVSGSAGDLYSQFAKGIFVSTSGGTPPYGGPGQSLNGDASGKLSLVPTGDGLHNTIGWSGFSLNELEGCYLQFDVTDSLGATASARYPSAGSIIIKRTS